MRCSPDHQPTQPSPVSHKLHFLMSHDILFYATSCSTIYFVIHTRVYSIEVIGVERGALLRESNPRVFPLSVCRARRFYRNLGSIDILGLGELLLYPEWMHP